MAMRELMRVELDAKTIRRACEWWAEGMTKGHEAEYTAVGISDEARCVVVLTKKRAPRKPKTNSVASAAPLSEAEQRFA